MQPHKLSLSFLNKPQPKFDNGLHIGVIGAINYAKGTAIVAEMAKIIESEGNDTTLTVIGPFDGWLRGKHITLTGPYKLEDLPSLLSDFRINICFLPSIWPETFSYVTSELMALDMPLCCFDLGAPAERVRGYSKGLIISQIDAAIALAQIRGFYESLKTKILPSSRNPSEPV
jgi:glycosyltransferase involved in cell wall biosynthesis